MHTGVLQGSSLTGIDCLTSKWSVSFTAGEQKTHSVALDGVLDARGGRWGRFAEAVSRPSPTLT